jgi:hypothetical protein
VGREVIETLAFIAEMDMGLPEGEGPVVYTCPMHPEAVGEELGHCPVCGMKLLPRQLVAEDGTIEANLVWKDTVLVRTGETVDILLDVTNVGLWMAHCHIAEHHESGMMFSFTVDP